MNSPVQKAVTDRRVMAIAIPIVLSNATVPILGAVDTGVIGQLGEAAPIGAVGIGAIILSAIYWIFGFLRMGTTGMVAQAHGAGDTTETKTLLVRALIVAATAGVGFILFQPVVFWLAFQASPAEPEVEALARTYLEIRIWSAPAAISVFALTGWLIAFERTREVMAIQLVMNCLNIALDLVFVLGFEWGVAGVAIATFIAEWSGAALGLWYCRTAFQGREWCNWPRIFNSERLRAMAGVNTDIMIRSILLEISLVSFLFIGSDFSTVVLAANQILLQFLMITAYAMDGFAFAAEAIIGQAMGAKDRVTLRRGAIVTSRWGLVTVIILSAAFLLGGNTLIDIMTTAQDVRETTRNYLPWMIVTPLIGCAAWMLDGIFIGATRTRDMRNAMLQSFAIYLVALAILVPFFENHGLWAALMISFIARGVTLFLRYPALERSAT